MKYVGYLRIDEYAITDKDEITDKNGITETNDDKTTVEKLQTLTPTNTKWIKIDGDTSFTTTPEKAGFTGGKKAYLLTYYAVPFDIENLSQVIVNNQFEISGDVTGIGTYTLTGIQVNASVTVEGNNSFQAEKNYWYYEAGTSDESLGTFYWILKIRGNMIPEETRLKDLIVGENHTMGTVKTAFTAKTIEDFSIYKNLNDLGSMEAFKDYSADREDSSLCITLDKTVILDEDTSLYFVVSTKPAALPEKLGESITYTNQLLSKDPVEGAEFFQQSEAKNTLTAGGNIYKELGAVFTAEKNAEGAITADNIKFLEGDEKTKLQLDHLEQSGGGTYVAWKVTVNKESNLNGRYRIKEQIPKGMEVTYIQQYSSPEYGKRPWFVDQGEMEGYIKVVKKYDKEYDQNPITAYYYVKDQEVIWDVNGLQANPSKPGSMYVTFLVVCKLTDKEVLLGGTEKEFTNQVWLQKTDGQELGYGSDSVELHAQTLSKKGTYDPNTSGGRYPFEIILNENGTDLLQGSDKIQLIDEMCDILILDPSSIKIVNTKTGEEVEVKAQYENNRLTLIIPDDQPLKITYTAAINAKPGDNITITNKAYWFGYTSNGSQVSTSIKNYQAGAYVGTNESPSVMIIKRDQYDTGSLLGDAEFSLQEMELKGNEFQEKTDGTTLSDITDSSGSLKFGDGKLAFNTVYRLTETKAPSGYVLIEDPIYLLIAKKVNDSYPEELDQYHKLGVKIQYESPQYKIDVYNHKGEIKVTKNFADAAGNSLGINLNGTYKFGLFENGTTEPIQRAEIIFNNGNMTPNDGARFTNVTLEKTYKVYELDDKGEPIESGKEGVVSGMPFIVTYEDNEVTVSTASPTAETTVTNRMNYAELPASGGLGSGIYTVSGGVLAAGAAGLLGVKIKRRKGRADHTEI